MTCDQLRADGALLLPPD